MFEFDEALRELTGSDIDELAGVSSLGQSFFAYRRSPHQEVAEIPVEAKAVINRILDRWGGESLNKILNYVYFETEPMQEAEWGEPLNLDVVHRRQDAVPLADLLASKASAERAKDVRRLKEEFWSKLSAREDDLVQPSPAPRYDEVFFEGLRVTDEER